MRLINRIFRFPVAIIITGGYAIIEYAATIFAMLALNWDEEYVSLKVAHKSVWKCFLNIMGLK